MIDREGDPRSERAIVRRLTAFYILALLLIAVIVVSFVGIGDVAINPARANDATTITLLLQERINGEVISLDSAAFIALEAPETSVPALSTALQSFKVNYQTLRARVAIESPGQDLSQARVALAELEPYYDALLLLGQNMVDLSKDTTLPPASLAGSEQRLVAEILSEDEAFDSGMVQVTSINQQDLDLRQSQQEVLDQVLIVLTLLALLLVGLAVFRPATRQVARSLQELALAEERQRELAALKDQFIIDANHELRTPIMALYNTLELLSAAGERALPERRTQLVQRALTVGDSVLSLLSNVLDTSILESRTPRLELKVVALEPLVRNVLETFDPREIGEPLVASATFTARAVTVNIPRSLEVWADEARVRQILINLISNALKYSGEGTPLSITAGALEESIPRQRRGRATTEDAPPIPRAFIQVRDQGLGVSPRDAVKLFNRFVRLERDIASTVHGTGVGLYVSRILVEAMGGHIWVESSGVPGDGSTFVFTLPCVPPTPVQNTQERPTHEFEAAGVLDETR